MLYLYCSLGILLVATKITLASNILFLPTSLGKSILKSDLPYALKLAERGHNVTIFTSAQESLLIGGTGSVKHIDKPLDYEDVKSFEQVNFWDYGTDSPWMYYGVIMGEVAPSAVLTLENHKQFMSELAKQNWDCIVFDPSYQYFGFVLANLIEAPRVNLISTFYETDHKRALRLPNSESFVHFAWFDINSFWSRFESFFLWQFADTIVEYVFDLDYAERLRPYFPNWINRVHEYEKATLWLALRSSSFDWPTALSHETLFVGGMSYKGTVETQLQEGIKDEQLNKFLSQPNKKGIIIASFGHYLSWKSIPQHITTAFKESFKRLPEYLFVWQYDGPAFDSTIPNVYVSPWIPQPQLLANPKAALFISHMGLKSVQEGTRVGLPFLAIPVFLDQHFNSHILVKRWNAGIIENRFTITAETMTENLREILTNPMYEAASRRIAEFQQDVIQEPTALAAFWIEYTMRHDAVMKPYFSSKAKNLNFFAFYLLDIIVVIFASITVVIFCMIKATRIFLSK